MDETQCILSFSAFGTWLCGPVRGRVVGEENTDFTLPEPDEALSRRRRRSLKWPEIRLDEAQRGIVLNDLIRVASIRAFNLRAALIAYDHAHVFFSCATETNCTRLVQFIKGATARALSVAGGGETVLTASLAPLPHHKWWTRQYVLQRFSGPEAVDRAVELFHTHSANRATVWMQSELRKA